MLKPIVFQFPISFVRLKKEGFVIFNNSIKILFISFLKG
jgi:uncharacterized protein YecE (DUF72 family)